MNEMKSLTLNGKTYDSFYDSVSRSLAVGSAVIDSASGENIIVTDASNYNFTGLRIFGKTTQDGTPTPDAPVELVSVGDNGSITVNVTGRNDAKSMTIATPNGLPGVPVESDGNYTDADGQQWVCDEIDFARGVYVQRIAKVVFDENSDVILSKQEQKPTTNVRFDFHNDNVLVLSQSVEMKQVLLSNYGTAAKSNNAGVWINNSASFQGRLSVDGTIASTVDQMKALLAVKPIEFIVPIAEPIVTPLSDEELIAYANLQTYRNNTSVSNDAGAWMEIEYIMDAKKYFDSLGGGGASARLGSITITSSKWTTVSEGLHSQIVSIPGITPYSKVDLLPSVEQLAIFHNKDVAFVTENEDGIVTVFAVGEKPTSDYTMQVSITEVTV